MAKVTPEARGKTNLSKVRDESRSPKSPDLKFRKVRDEPRSPAKDLGPSRTLLFSESQIVTFGVEFLGFAVELAIIEHSVNLALILHSIKNGQICSRCSSK